MPFKFKIYEEEYLCIFTMAHGTKHHTPTLTLSIIDPLTVCHCEFHLLHQLHLVSAHPPNRAFNRLYGLGGLPPIPWQGHQGPSHGLFIVGSRLACLLDPAMCCNPKPEIIVSQIPCVIQTHCYYYQNRHSIFTVV